MKTAFILWTMFVVLTLAAMANAHTVRHSLRAMSTVSSVIGR